MGLERVFEAELRGKDGGIVMEVDARGRLKGVLERIPWQPGSNVHLTLDATVQKAADDGLRASLTGRGAAVALDPRTGDILALSSAPDFDPNDFLSSDPELVQRTAQALPQLNRAIAATYPPGRPSRSSSEPRGSTRAASPRPTRCIAPATPRSATGCSSAGKPRATS